MYITTCACILIAVLTAGVQAITESIDGYGVEDFTWEIETFPGGPKKNLTGTVQEVASQLTTINPNWKTDFNISDTLERRLSFPFTGLLCDVNQPGWGWASASAISDGINYLNGVPGNPTNGPGPGNCGRVSCSWNSAIWWCNDETQTLSLPGFSTIAAGAQVILSGCYFDEGINGQAFAQFLQNWNVIVRGGNC